ncbi:MAG TPA: aspartate 1-decarboxylase [Candidatus Kapabacteria bacterium]|nr:aspartate 1-decarboxylase [Candidatus Kapabacteria bacterium]HPO63982.1 aspartate 1-decarboxylase [Candidatus Kapabacteria bacterium]
MFLTLLKSKIHRATITEANLEYEGSFTIDEDIMDEAGILPYEKVAIVNINNGERLETYVIPGERGKRTFCLNGAAARKGAPGDRVIIISYAQFTPDEVKQHKPVIILVDRHNNIIKKTDCIEPNQLFEN